MPRKLRFKIDKTEYESFPVRIDRRKLYGWTELSATDENGISCRLLSADESGRDIIPPRGTGAGILSETGRWVEKSDLRVVDAEGKTPPLYRSSFDRVNELTEEVSAQEFLDYSITDFYHLADAPQGLAEAVGNRIFRMDFTYNDSYDPSTAFVLATGSGLFLMLGVRNRYEMLCFGDCESVEEEGDGPLIEEGDEDIDFSMF